LTQFNKYAGSSAWSVVAAVPAITLAYIVGAFMLVIADFLFQHFNRPGYDAEWRLLKMLAQAQSDVLTQQFHDFIRTKRILEGSAIPLGVLAIGIWLEILNLPTLTWVLIVAGLAVAAVALLSPFFTNRVGKNLDRLEALASEIIRSKGGPS
jgi:hypothetical protein